MTFTSLLLALAGLCLLALSMHRHAVQAGWRFTEKGKRLARFAGWAVLTLSCAVRFSAGRGIGVVEWIGMVGFCAGIVALVLAFRPRVIPAAVAPLLILALLSGVS